MVLLNWGIKITFPSHCCAAVYAGDPLCPLILVISAGLSLAYPGDSGNEVQGEEGQRLCLWWRSGGSV